MKRKTLHFRNGKVLQNHLLIKQDFWVANGRVAQTHESAEMIIDASGLLIAPGFIDIHMNGLGGVDFNTSPELLEKAAKLLPGYGITSFLPTVISSSPDHYRKILPHLQPREGGAQGAEVLGIHLEGPFLNPQKCGAHEASKIINARISPSAFKECYGSLEGVRLVTLAPELPDMLDCISFLKENNITASAGHTDATWREMEKGVKQGISMATHLFNAMRPLSQREPGIIGYVLDNPHLFFSLIADEVHLHPGILSLARKTSGDNLILISDAISGLGMPPGNYPLGDINVSCGSHACLPGSNTLAGSLLHLHQAVLNFQKMTDASLIEALEAASLTPARLLGLCPQKGALEVGSDADLVLLDAELNVHSCYVNGELAFSRMGYD